MNKPDKNWLSSFLFPCHWCLTLSSVRSPSSIGPSGFVGVLRPASSTFLPFLFFFFFSPCSASRLASVRCPSSVWVEQLRSSFPARFSPFSGLRAPPFFIFGVPLTNFGLSLILIAGIVALGLGVQAGGLKLAVVGHRRPPSAIFRRLYAYMNFWWGMVLARRVQIVGSFLERVIQDPVAQRLKGANKHFCLWYTTVSTSSELPRKLKKSERKPLVRGINELKRDARQKKKDRQKVHEIILEPPENGLLVKQLIPVAHEVYAARSELLSIVSRLVKHIAIYTCSLCGEAHVGHPPHKIKSCNVRGSLSSKLHSWVRGDIEHVLPIVESFHLYDRIGRAVSHKEMLEVDRIPAIVELCVQAGVDIPEYPTRRRDFPIYCVAGRIIDFEKRFPKYISLGKDIDASGFWYEKKRVDEDVNLIELLSDDTHAIAVQGMKAWKKMCAGASKLMEKYPVQTCGYCPEVQVGPKGHRVRNCQAYKHQMRDGQHAWQEATTDYLLPPVYVYHIPDPQSSEPLVNGLKRYYGMLPAVVELFAQAGAPVGKKYASAMREDVVVPTMDEAKWAV